MRKTHEVANVNNMDRGKTDKRREGMERPNGSMREREREREGGGEGGREKDNSTHVQSKPSRCGHPWLVCPPLQQQLLGLSW